jgi:molybdopterin synthase catalytic subunit
VPVGESAVVVAVSAPHRDEAFLAARYCIDAVKASVPIWKHETWAGGEAWGSDAQELMDANELRRSNG